MLALQRQDLAAMTSFAPLGARLLRPPGELPPLAAEEAVCPMLPPRKAATATIEDGPANSQDSVAEPPAGQPDPRATPRRGQKRPPGRSNAQHLVGKQALVKDLAAALKMLATCQKDFSKAIRPQAGRRH